jgi:hypothetical protein
MMTGTVGMIILSVATIFLFSAFKASSDNGKAELILSVRNYLDKNVKPIMQPQRVKLNGMLSADEKKELAQLNTQLRQLISKRNSTGIGFITSPEMSLSQSPAFTPKQKAEQKASRDEMRRIMARAWAIADRHETEIAQLLNEKTTFYGTWERGISALVKDYLDDRFLFIGSKQIISRFENREIMKYYSPVAFLLWDPNQRFIGDELIRK